MKILEDSSIFSGRWKTGPDRQGNKYHYYYTREHYTDFECLFASPLCSDSMLYAHSLVKHRLLPGHRAWLGRPDFLSLRLVLNGSEYVRYDGKCYCMEPGDLMIFLPFHDYEFMTGPDGFSEKRSIVMKGSLLHAVLAQSNLSGKISIPLKAPASADFLEAYEALRRTFVSRDEPVPSLNAGICFQLLQRLSDECRETAVPPILDAFPRSSASVRPRSTSSSGGTRTARSIVTSFRAGWNGRSNFSSPGTAPSRRPRKGSGSPASSIFQKNSRNTTEAPPGISFLLRTGDPTHSLPPVFHDPDGKIAGKRPSPSFSRLAICVSGNILPGC